MRLFLVQHGVAKSGEEDPARPLTEEGAEAVRRIATWAAGQGLAVDRIRHSGKRRAEETAELFAGALGPDLETQAVMGMGPVDDVHTVAEGLGDELGSLMLVGHLPFMARLAGVLLAGSADATPVAFTNAGIVCLERDEARWTLAWLVRPEQVG